MSVYGEKGRCHFCSVLYRNTVEPITSTPSDRSHPLPQLQLLIGDINLDIRKLLPRLNRFNLVLLLNCPLHNPSRGGSGGVKAEALT